MSEELNDDVRAAAERLRRHESHMLAEPVELHLASAVYDDGGSLSEDRRILAQAYLAEHPVKDDEGES